MEILTKEEPEPYENAKFCYIYKERFEDEYAKEKKYLKVWDHCHYTGKYRGVRIAYAISSLVHLKIFL